MPTSTYTPFAHWLVDGTQVVSAVLGLVALVVALIALVKSKSDLLRERRVAHELEILRGLVDLTPPGDEIVRYRDQIRVRLLMIPGSEDMPLTRAALFAKPSEDCLTTFTEKFPDAPCGQSRNDVLARFSEVGWPQFYWELLIAVSRRVEPS